MRHSFGFLVTYGLPQLVKEVVLPQWVRLLSRFPLHLFAEHHAILNLLQGQGFWSVYSLSLSKSDGIRRIPTRWAYQHLKQSNVCMDPVIPCLNDWAVGGFRGEDLSEILLSMQSDAVKILMH